MEKLRSLEDLLDLQQVDLEIDRLLSERSSLPELAQYRAAHEKAASLEAEHAVEAEALKAAELDLDRTSGELELAEAKLEAEQNRLYAGGLSARDAQYMRQEVEMLTRKKGEMEEQVLELMERREMLEAARDRLAARLEEANIAKSSLEAVIAEAWRGIDARIARKEARKADIVPLVAEDLLELYEQLRPAKEGVAVGRLSEGVCGGCHLRLTAAERLEVAAADPPRCIHCRRILVV